MAEGIRRRDGMLLKRAAHKLKGSVGVFGASEALATATAVELQARNNNFTGLIAMHARLQLEIDSLQKALHDFLAAAPLIGV